VHCCSAMTPGRHDDERLYQPRIHSRRIRELHRLSEETGERMTVLVDRALYAFMEQRGRDSGRSKGDDEKRQQLPDRTKEQS